MTFKMIFVGLLGRINERCQDVLVFHFFVILLSLFWRKKCLQIWDSPCQMTNPRYAAEFLWWWQVLILANFLEFQPSGKWRYGLKNYWTCSENLRSDVSKGTVPGIFQRCDTWHSLYIVRGVKCYPRYAVQAVVYPVSPLLRKIPENNS